MGLSVLSCLWECDITDEADRQKNWFTMAEDTECNITKQMECDVTEDMVHDITEKMECHCDVIV